MKNLLTTLLLVTLFGINSIYGALLKYTYTISDIYANTYTITFPNLSTNTPTAPTTGLVFDASSNTYVSSFIGLPETLNWVSNCFPLRDVLQQIYMHIEGIRSSNLADDIIFNIIIPSTKTFYMANGSPRLRLYNGVDSNSILDRKTFINISSSDTNKVKIFLKAQGINTSYDNNIFFIHSARLGNNNYTKFNEYVNISNLSCESLYLNSHQGVNYTFDYLLRNFAAYTGTLIFKENRMIWTNDINNVIVQGCSFKNNFGEAINIAGDGINMLSYTSKEMNILNNVIVNCIGLHLGANSNYYDNTGDGILITGTRKYCVENNSITNNYNIPIAGIPYRMFGRGGIVLDRFNYEGIIRNNTISGYDRNIHIESSVGGTVISKNSILGSNLGILFIPFSNNYPYVNDNSNSTFLRTTIKGNSISNYGLDRKPYVIGQFVPGLIEFNVVANSSSIYEGTSICHNSLRLKQDLTPINNQYFYYGRVAWESSFNSCQFLRSYQNCLNLYNNNFQGSYTSYSAVPMNTTSPVVDYNINNKANEYGHIVTNGSSTNSITLISELNAVRLQNNNFRDIKWVSPLTAQQKDVNNNFIPSSSPTMYASNANVYPNMYNTNSPNLNYNTVCDINTPCLPSDFTSFFFSYSPTLFSINLDGTYSYSSGGFSLANGDIEYYKVYIGKHNMPNIWDAIYDYYPNGVNWNQGAPLELFYSNIPTGVKFFKYEHVLRKKISSSVNGQHSFYNEVRSSKTFQVNILASSPYINYSLISSESDDNIFCPKTTLYTDGYTVNSVPTPANFALIKPIGNINNESELSTISIYPNPLNNELFISGLQIDDNHKTIIEVYNLLGQLEFKKLLISPESLDISSLTSGMKLIVLKDENGNKLFSQKYLKL